MISLIFVFISFQLFLNPINAQFKLEIKTNKSNYEYGEKIYITCSVINTTNQEVKIISSSSGTCQAEFQLNDYRSKEMTICLPMVQEITFAPYSSRDYNWTIDPKVFGLPNKDGEQILIGEYFYNNLRDTIKFQAPIYNGGQLKINCKLENEDSINTIKNNLNIEVLDRYEYDVNFSETWQLENINFDSIYTVFKNNDVFNYVEYNRLILYDSIGVTSTEDLKEINNEFYLSNAYPNPFNPTTNFTLQIPESGLVKIDLYNSIGEKVYRIFSGENIGNINYTYEVDAKNLTSGVYYITAIYKNQIRSKKIILLK